MVKPKINTVFFDAAGTLIFLREEVGKSYAAIAVEQGLVLEPRAVSEAFRRVWKGFPARIPVNGPREDDDRGWWKKLAMAVLEEVSPVRKGFDEEAWFDKLYSYFALPGVWEVYPDVIPALEQLRGKYRMAVISNFDRRLYPVLEDLKLTRYFEEIIISSEVGAEKPDRRIFETALARLNITADRAIHVGDDARRDIEGANAMGIETFAMHRPETTFDDLLRTLLAEPAATNA